MSDADEFPLEETSEPVDVKALHEPIIREYDEPADGFEPVPSWMLILFGLTLFWSGYYLAAFHAGWTSQNLDSFDAVAAPAAPNLGFDTPEKLQFAGKGVYHSRCAQCHQDDGQGIAGKSPKLVGAAMVNAADAVPLIRVPLFGLNDKCPAQAAILSDDQIAAALTFIRQEWGNSGSTVLPKDVTALRK